MTINGSRCGGFQYELLDKYGAIWGPYLHSMFGSLFRILPVATLVNNVVLVIHGGVGRDPENQLRRLQDLDADLREAAEGFIGISLGLYWVYWGFIGLILGLLGL